MAHATPARQGGQDGQGNPAADAGVLAPWHLSTRRRGHFRHVPAQEEIYGIYHPHVIVFLRSLIRPVLLLILLFVLLLVLSGLDPVSLPGPLQAIASVGGVLLSVVLLAALAWAIYAYFDWRADHLVITDQRVVLNIETPGIRRVLRDVPMGKVQNVVSHQAGLDHLINKALGVATLVIDTAGLGQVVLPNISEKDAEAARTIILALQGGVRGATKSSRESYRQAVVRNILYGTPLPAQPVRNEVRPAPRSGYNLLNVIFPLRPAREGLRVVWHRHWWFLLKAEAVPLLALLVFEVTTLIVSAAGNLLGTPDNPIAGIFAFLRPIVYILLLPAMLWQWEDWRNDRYVLDNDRLLTVDRLPFGLDETVKETEIRRVVDATVSIQGALPNLLRFGDVVMKTPGEKTEFLFAGVPRPFQIHQEIMARIEAEREREQAQWDRDIQEWLRAYVETRRAEPQPAPPPPPESWPWSW